MSQRGLRGMELYTSDDDDSTDSIKLPRAFKAWRSKRRQYLEDYNTKMKGIIFHYGLFKIVWDWFVLFLVLYTAIEVPFLVCFLNDLPVTTSFPPSHKSDPVAYVLFVIDLSVDMFFFCDIVVNFRTTYVGKKGVLVTSPKKIAARYLRSYFVVDLVAAVPWDVIVGQNPSTRESTVSLSLLKTVRLLRLFQAARRLDQNYEKSVSLLFLMVFVFTLVAHWLACIWYSIGHSESSTYRLSWLSILAEQTGEPLNQTLHYGPSLRSRYLTSLYFTLTCLTSVGFGNVSPNTDWERVFTICSMLIGGLLFAAVFGNVSAIIYGHYSGTFKFRERMQSVKHFLSYHKIKGPLARKVKDYSRHLWTQTKGISTTKVLKQFPESLQEEINCYLHFNVIKNCPLFEHADDSCLWVLASRMIQLHHLPNNAIVRQGAIVNSLFFINRGRLDVCRNGAIVGSIGEGDAFGNLSIGPETGIHKSAVTIRTITCVEIHILYLKDLNELLELFPEFSKELVKKTKSVLKKTVLTSQILSSWDAIEVEESARHNGIDFFGGWLRRQKSKRNCSMNRDIEMDFKKLNKKRRVNETLVTLPLVVLSPVCTSNEDAQKFWRFANIIDSGATGHNDKRNSTVSASSSTYYSSKEEELEQKEEKLRKPNNKNRYCHLHDDHCLPNNVTKPGDNFHSSDCHLHRPTSQEPDACELKHYETLESSVQHISKKLKSLENKLDTILFYLEKDKETTEDRNV